MKLPELLTSMLLFLKSDPADNLRLTTGGEITKQMLLC